MYVIVLQSPEAFQSPDLFAYALSGTSAFLLGRMPCPGFLIIVPNKALSH